MRFAFIHAEKAHHSVRTLCRVLQVSKSGYYTPPSARTEPTKA